ncbi:MAG: NAD(P)H-dependent oxidoreductase [Patescibacteria group bacterium]|nr:NAD(P)H-dependent oxidoreductase [Patescibacteria group bacterium]
MENQKIKILGVAGSLRKGSYNKMLLKEALRLAPKDVEINIFDIKDIPLFNQDLELNLPKSVINLKNKIKESDAILLVTPEYNYSIPGVLKNVIDWGSRPYGNNSWDKKPVAIMGASIGGFGTIRAQTHLRQTFIFTNMFPINNELFVSRANGKFDQNGNLTDNEIREKIIVLLQNLVDWTKKLK